MRDIPPEEAGKPEDRHDTAVHRAARWMVGHAKFDSVVIVATHTDARGRTHSRSTQIGNAFAAAASVKHYMDGIESDLKKSI